MRSLARLAHAEIDERPPQVAVGIGENELAVAGLGRAGYLPATTRLGDVDVVPALLDRHDDLRVVCPALLGSPPGGPLVHHIHVVHPELEVHAATEGQDEGSGSEAAPRPDRFLDHQLDAVALQVGEALGGSLEDHTEAEDTGVEPDGRREVRHIDLRDEHAR